MNYRRFTIKGHFDVDIDDEDYEPTDDEWLACAKEMFENDEFNWMDSSVTED